MQPVANFAVQPIADRADTREKTPGEGIPDVFAQTLARSRPAADQPRRLGDEASAARADAGASRSNANGSSQSAANDAKHQRNAVPERTDRGNPARSRDAAVDRAHAASDRAKGAERASDAADRARDVGDAHEAARSSQRSADDANDDAPASETAASDTSVAAEPSTSSLDAQAQGDVATLGLDLVAAAEAALAAIVTLTTGQSGAAPDALPPGPAVDAAPMRPVAGASALDQGLAAMLLQTPDTPMDAVVPLKSDAAADAAANRVDDSAARSAGDLLLESAPDDLVALVAGPATEQVKGAAKSGPTEAAAAPVSPTAAANQAVATTPMSSLGNDFQQPEGGNAEHEAGNRPPANPQPATQSETAAQPAARSDAPAPVTAPRATPAVAEPNPVDRAVAQQVARALSSHDGMQGRPLVVRLTPPELGTVRIEVFERAGQITARIHAEDAAVRVALERFLPQMKQDLRAHDAPIHEVVLADAYQQNASPDRGRGDEQTGNRRQRPGRDGIFAVDGVREAPLVRAGQALGGHVANDAVDARA